MSLLHGLYLSCLWAEFCPQIADPISDEPDEVGDRPQGAKVAAPGSADKQRANEHDPQQHKMKVGPD